MNQTADHSTVDRGASNDAPERVTGTADLNRLYRQHRALDLICHATQPPAAPELARAMAPNRRAPTATLEEEITDLLYAGAPILPIKEPGPSQNGKPHATKYRWIATATRQPYDWNLSRRLTTAALITGNPESIQYAITTLITWHQPGPAPKSPTPKTLPGSVQTHQTPAS